MQSNLQIITVPDKYILKYKGGIAKWKVAGNNYTSTIHNPVDMFSKLKPNREIRLLADLVPCNHIMVKDHGHILN
jgi:hypothetical protein